MPTRSERAPPTGASRNGITAAGRVSRPATHGDAPSPIWRSCATRKSPPKRAAYISSDASPAVANTRLPKNRSGRMAPGVRRSQQHEGHQQHDPGTGRREHLGAGPPDDVATHQCPHDAEQSAAAQRDPGQVEVAVRPVALGQVATGQHHQQQAERHVDPEDPAPARRPGQAAAHERSERGAQPSDTAPRTEHLPAAMGCRGDREDGQRHRGEQGGSGSLGDASGDERCRPMARARPRRRPW